MACIEEHVIGIADMKINLVKLGDVLAPLTPGDEYKYSLLKQHNVIVGEVLEERNSLYHRKFFSMMHVVFENQDKYKTMQEFLNVLKVKVGWCDCYYVDDKHIVIPKSISFKKMDQHQFEVFYSMAIDAILDMLPQLTHGDIEEIAKEVISYA